MKIRIASSFITCVSVALVSMSCAAAESERKVALSSEESAITWVGRKVTGSHAGTVGLKGGEVVLDGETIKSGSFQIDLSQLAVSDIKDAENNSKLVSHLKSDDFFAVAAFPTVQFTIDSAEALKAPLPSGENVTVKGALTVKGISKPVEFPAKVSVKDGVAEASGKVTLDRTNWDIKYKSGKFFQGLGDKLIYDTFEVDFTVKGKVVG
jgi:polyisoprenoid-binding protein YceI